MQKMKSILQHFVVGGVDGSSRKYLMKNYLLDSQGRIRDSTLPIAVLLWHPINQRLLRFQCQSNSHPVYHRHQYNSQQWDIQCQPLLIIHLTHSILFGSYQLSISIHEMVAFWYNITHVSLYFDDNSFRKPGFNRCSFSDETVFTILQSIICHRIRGQRAHHMSNNWLFICQMHPIKTTIHISVLCLLSVYCGWVGVCVWREGMKDERKESTIHQNDSIRWFTLLHVTRDD